MPEYRLIRHCAPTLAGIKTGSLFLCPCRSEQALLGTLHQWNRLLGPKGLCVLPLRRRQSGALVYVYRPALLGRDLARRDAADLLLRYGYPSFLPARCVARLTRRVRGQESFPHEIGLFLGYPPEDVRGFIEHGGQNCKCEGCWKVYGDAAAAQQTFLLYTACTRLYCDRWAAGVPLDRLAADGCSPFSPPS